MSARVETTETEPTPASLQGMAVEYVVFDRADRPKRRRLLPLAGLLAPLAGGAAVPGGMRDAG